eukprot:scaffold143_cov364-Pavlova_lutheri.AAC.21
MECMKANLVKIQANVDDFMWLLEDPVEATYIFETLEHIRGSGLTDEECSGALVEQGTGRL